MPDVTGEAHDFIAGYLGGYFFDCEETEPAEQAALDLLKAMAESGLVVVQLPDPDEHNEWGGTDWCVWISRGGVMQVREPGYMSHPIKARQFAAALLAAAAAVSGANK